MMKELVTNLQKEHPTVRWIVGNVQDRTFHESLGTFDLVFLLEVLQCVRIRETINGLWENLVPDGWSRWSQTASA
jgi:hypothetical protein